MGGGRGNSHPRRGGGGRVGRVFNDLRGIVCKFSNSAASEGGGGVRSDGGQGLGRVFNDLRGIPFKSLHGAEGVGELVVGGGVSALVGAFGGRVAAKEAEGAAEMAVVEGESPVELAMAEAGDVEEAIAGDDEIGDEVAMCGVGGGAGIEGSAGEGGLEPVVGEGSEGGAVAPVVGGLGPVGVGIECGLHGG